MLTIIADYFGFHFLQIARYAEQIDLDVGIQDGVSLVAILLWKLMTTYDLKDRQPIRIKRITVKI